MELSQSKISMMLKRFGWKPNELMYSYPVGAIRKNSSKRKSSFMGRVNECVHDCLNNNMFVSMMGGTITFMLMLILGSYAYTWNELKTDGEEKAQWRLQHERQLDRKFEEVKLGQREVRDSLERSNNDTRDMLKQILDGQKQAKEQYGRRN